MPAYYNEFDPLKAEVVRQAIKDGAIAPGDVDERSIADVQPSDLVGYEQCHFFAGGGFWSLALRYAGWPDDRPAWTGSCPCPSFSAAGKGRGFDDARHLWPDWYRLIRECRPGVIFGEQVAAAIGHGWLDLVCGDLEAEGYAVAAAVLGAHSVGAPHIRQRLYFCADTESLGRSGRPHNEDRGRWELSSGHTGEAGNDAHSESNGRLEGRPEPEGLIGRPDAAEHSCAGLSEHSFQSRLEGHFGDVREWRGPGWLDPLTARSVAEAGATRGFWADCDWWYGRDEKYRPAGPGVQPLAHGSPARVGRLRMYGDAICVPTAQAFIESYIEAREID